MHSDSTPYELDSSALGDKVADADFMASFRCNKRPLLVLLERGFVQVLVPPSLPTMFPPPYSPLPRCFFLGGGGWRMHMPHAAPHGGVPPPPATPHVVCPPPPSPLPPRRSARSRRRCRQSTSPFCRRCSTGPSRTPAPSCSSRSATRSPSSRRRQIAPPPSPDTRRPTCFLTPLRLQTSGVPRRALSPTSPSPPLAHTLHHPSFRSTILRLACACAGRVPAREADGVARAAAADRAAALRPRRPAPRRRQGASTPPPPTTARSHLRHWAVDGPLAPCPSTWLHPPSPCPRCAP